MPARIGTRGGGSAPRPLSIGLAVAAVLAVAVAAFGSATARASGCENSWADSKGGSWFNAENWSRKAVPAAGEEVCITEPGTYTVQMTEATATVSVKSLTLGAASGTQTLAVGSTCSVNAVLATSSGLAVTANGAVTLTNGDGCGNSVTLSGPITSAGSITSVHANGGERSLQGSLTNTGVLNINTVTRFNGVKTALDNEGALNVAEGVTLGVSGENSVTNGAGGSISGTGNGAVVLTGGAASFTEGAGTTSGSKPVIVEDGAVTYSGAGAGTIALRGAGKLAGTSSAGQTLLLESTCSKNASVTASAGFVNGGAISMTNGDGCGNHVTLTLSGGSLQNSGSLTTVPANGGERNLQGNLLNTGTLNIDATTHFNGSKGALTNEGTLNVAEGKALQVSAEGSVSNLTGGKIAATGNGVVTVAGAGTSFTEGAGTTSGAQPVILEDSALDYAGSGESAISLRGGSSLAGNLSAGQSLSVQSTCGKNAALSIGSSLTSAGAVTLTNGDGCGNNVAVNVASGATLTNSGTLTVEHANGGSRALSGRFANTATMLVNSQTSLSGAESQLAQKGSLTIATGLSLLASGGAAVANEAGTVTGTGTGALVVTAGTFTEGAGKTSGSRPMIVEDGTLTYSGSGEGPVSLRGTTTLNGAPAAGQTLSLESTCSKNVSLSLPAGATNAGSIVLTNGDGCANNVTVQIGAGQQLVNTGTITTVAAIGGGRTITGSLANSGTLAIEANTTYGGTGTVLTNTGTISIAEGRTLHVVEHSEILNEAGSIAATGSGVMLLAGGAFQEKAGTVVGTQPVVIEDGTLAYTGKGAGVIALRGASKVSGVPVKEVATFPNKGQTLELQSTCSKNASISAASFTNAGTIVLTNGDGCGNNVTFSLAGGTLTNKATIKAEHAAGGGRTIEAPVVNEKTVGVSVGGTLKVQGSYTQTKKGTYAPGVNTGLSAGLLTVSGTATLEGSLSLAQTKGLTATEGQKVAVLGAASLSGTFTKLKKVKIAKTKPALKFNPVYSGSGVSLEVGA